MLDIIDHHALRRFSDAGCTVHENYPLANLTTYGVGGPADVFIIVPNESALIAVMTIISEYHYPWKVLGNGSNVLISDAGVRGCVLQLNGDFSLYKIEKYGTVQSGCAHSLIQLSHSMIRHALSGLEFSCGIPGSIGGSVRMNAGAYSGELKDVVTSVRYYSVCDKKVIEKETDLQWGYRTSMFRDSNDIICSVTLQLTPAEPEGIRRTVIDYTQHRKNNQPTGKRSAGSVFKNTNEYQIWQLIDECGLRGYRRGKAMISEKHTNWIVVDHGCSAREIYDLQEEIIQQVAKKFGIVPEREQELIGDFS